MFAAVHWSGFRGRLLAVLFLFFYLTLVGCSGGGGDGAGVIDLISSANADEPEPEVPAPTPPQLRPASNASEYTGIATYRRMTAEEVLAVLSQLLGADAESGAFLSDYEIQPGLLLGSTGDSRTGEQMILAVDMLVSGDTTPSRRVLFRGPASFAYGDVFYKTVESTLDAMPEDSGSTRPFTLEYRTRSALGGELALGVSHSEDGGLRLSVDINSPRTSLIPGRINQPYLEGQPYETVYGLVNFTLSRDQFDFFSTRAYGLSAGANQNFSDFELFPWLRLTVVPQLEDLTVNVAFDILTTGGQRIPASSAPASVLAGEQFRENVFLMVDNMNAAEARLSGSSVAWSVPFYYDDPAGGGIVEVLAEGRDGVFAIAYAIETPTNQLLDVEFVSYQGEVDIPADWDAPRPTCEALGSETALDGRFDITFNASSTVRDSSNLDGPLRGTVIGSIFRAADVTVRGPIDGAESVSSFRFEDVNVEALSGSPQSYRIETVLPAGDYQVLGFMDIDENEGFGDGGPDENDPVMVPIGAYSLECANQPITVEFAILLPAGI